MTSEDSLESRTELNKPKSTIRFVTAEEAKELQGTKGVVVYNAASRKTHRFLNPFHVSELHRIPVPGLEGVFSKSVEAIWQGLKLVGGETDYAMFENRPHKRPGTRQRQKDESYDYAASEFKLGDRVVDLVTARREIYVPAYTFLFENYVPRNFKEDVRRQVLGGTEVIIHDVDPNGNIEDTSSSYAHASLLVELLNDYIDRSVHIVIGHLKKTIKPTELLEALEYKGAEFDLQERDDRFQMDAAYSTYLAQQIGEDLKREGFEHLRGINISYQGNRVRESVDLYQNGERVVRVIRSHNFKEPFKNYERTHFVLETDDATLKPMLQTLKENYE